MATSPPITKPLLKWVGGKSQILEEVLARFPSRMAAYHEPFLGGGSVLLGLLSYRKAGRITVTGGIYASDANPNLIHLYRTVQTTPTELLHALRGLVAEFATATGTCVNRAPTTLEEARTSPESYYYWVRKRFNALRGEERTTPAAAAMFLFLNKTCFRGLYREGPNGFNVPYGNYKQPGILDETHLHAVSDLLQGVVFTVQPFQASLAAVTSPDDFVYLDPPYAPETGTSFVGYTADGFNEDTHKTLFQRCAELCAQGTRILMSNANVPLVRNAFPAPAFQTELITCRRAIHSKKPDSKTTEVLIRGVQPPSSS